MAGNVRVEGKMFRDLRSGHTVAFACEQVDLPAGSVSKGGGDGGYGRGEAFVGRGSLSLAGGFTHTVMVPVAVPG